MAIISLATLYTVLALTRISQVRVMVSWLAKPGMGIKEGVE